MTTKLYFSLAELDPIINHSLCAAERAWPYGMVPEGMDANAPAGLYLVKDSGIYLMSNSTHRQSPVGGGEGCRVAYAVGFDPNTDEDVWERSRDAVGGDDFVEMIEVEDINEMIGRDKVGCTHLEIRMTATSMAIALAKRKSK
jgi:hypothetical protein